MSLRNIEAVYSSAEIIQEASSFLEKHTAPAPHLTALIESVAEEANNHKGAIVDLTVQHKGVSTSGIDMGKSRFNGFVMAEDGKWLADFSLVPEDVPCPVGVEHILVR